MCWRVGALLVALLAVGALASSDPAEADDSDQGAPGAHRTTPAPERQAGRLVTLSDVSAGLCELSAQNVSFETILDRLAAILTQVASLPPSQAPISIEESRTVSRIVWDLGVVAVTLQPDLVYASLLDFYEFHDWTNNGVSRFDVDLSGGAWIMFRGDVDLVPGTQEGEDGIMGFYAFPSKTPGFEFGSTLLRREGVVFVAFAENASPLRPVPAVGYPITRLQVLLVISDEVKENDVRYFICVARLRWTLGEHAVNARFGCGRWDETRDGWASDDCVVAETKGTPNSVSCLCGCTGTHNVTSEYAIYQYVEDIASTISVDRTEASDGVTSNDSSQLKAYAKDFGESVARRAPLVECLSLLSRVLRFDKSALLDSFGDKVLADVGTVLEDAEPQAGQSTIGVRNNDLASFVVDLHRYKRDPPIGFAVYNNYSFGMEYFRFAYEVDFRKVFAVEFACSLLFSKSVVSQNSRYAFLLYPPDKFFKLAAVIDGHRVSSMRVLDLVLTPGSRESRHNQSVHLFLGRVVDTTRSVGCASWSASLGDWSSADCHPDADLHDGVCTCIIAASRSGEASTRGQYLVFTYVSASIAAEPVAVEPDNQQYKSAVSVFCVHEHRLAPERHTQELIVIGFLENLVNDKDLTPSARRQVVQDARLSTLDNRCYQDLVIDIHGFVAVCYDYYTSDYFLGHILNITGFEVDLFTRDLRLSTHLEGSGSVQDLDVFGATSAFGLQVSPSVLTQNERYAFLLYPRDQLFFKVPRPPTGKVFAFRMVDVVLLPKDNHDRQVGQHVLFYLAHPKNMTVGCAFWSEERAKWTSDGCSVVTVNAAVVCNCSLTAGVDEARSGGQFIVYIHTTAAFDDGVFAAIANETFTDAAAIFKQGAALIRNASMSLTSNDVELVRKVLLIYYKILATAEVVPLKQTLLKRILVDLDQVFDRFYAYPGTKINVTFYMPTISLTVDDSDLADDAVLSNDTVDAVAVGSGSALAAFGFFDTYVPPSEERWIGVLLPRTNAVDESLNVNSTEEVLKSDPAFACFLTCYHLAYSYRYVVAVYPLNLSPFPYTMSARSLLNSRQVDVYATLVPATFGYGYGFVLPTCDAVVNVVFQPTASPKDYAKTGCATWDEAADAWTTDLCAMDDVINVPKVACSCNITARRVTRIMIFEFADVDNFTLVTLFEGPSVAFLTAASFSLFAFVMIAATAVAFPAWRARLGNKLLLCLASSSLLYLSLTMVRETHLIFSDIKRLDVGLVAFIVAVRYARLVLHCWGLAVSVLEYKWFARVDEAATTRRFLLKVCLLVWGVPLAPLAVLLAWDVRSHFCTADKFARYTLHLLPVVAIVALNLGFLVDISRKMTDDRARRDDGQRKKHDGLAKEALRRKLKHTAFVFLLFSVPTVLEMVRAAEFDNVFLNYCVNFLIPFQGFVIFLFFVVMNEKTRVLWTSRAAAETAPAVNRTLTKGANNYKTKTTKKAAKPKTIKIRAQNPDAIQAPAEVEQKASVEPEIQITVHDGDYAVKYVVKGSEDASLDVDEIQKVDEAAVLVKEEAVTDNASSCPAIFDSRHGDMEGLEAPRDAVGGDEDLRMPPEMPMPEVVEDLRQFGERLARRRAVLKEFEDTVGCEGKSPLDQVDPSLNVVDLLADLQMAEELLGILRNESIDLCKY